MRATQIWDINQYINLVKSQPTEERALSDGLLTHTTGFFREPAHFDWLRENGLENSKASVIDGQYRVWSAACSTGAELWSVAMELANFQNKYKAPIKAELLGTDISRHILKRARDGIFSTDEISGISNGYTQLFMQKSSSSARRFRVCKDLCRLTTFSQFNLLQDCVSTLGKFDLILLRNILIYFDKKDQQHVFDQVVSALRWNGALMLGHTETLSIDTSALSRVAPAIFVKEG